MTRYRNFCTACMRSDCRHFRTLIVLFTYFIYLLRTAFEDFPVPVLVPGPTDLIIFVSHFLYATSDIVHVFV